MGWQRPRARGPTWGHLPEGAAGALPLLVEPPVLLPVGAVDLQQGLQVVVVRLHILVVHIDIVQLPLLLENLLCGACETRGQELGPRGHHPPGNRSPGARVPEEKSLWGAGRRWEVLGAEACGQEVGRALYSQAT